MTRTVCYLYLLPCSFQESLGELVPSQWGPAHLFDLCLWFGHIDTALALVSHGVTGCTLEDRHLGALPDARDAGDYGCFTCGCEGWQTCSYCCWAFPVENGVWMKDWDAHLDDAANAAQQAAKTPLVRGIVEISSRTKTLLFAMSDAAAARLLDIAILCGNVEAATNYQARPLRRWDATEMWHFAGLARWGSRFSAALCAGADFEGVYVRLIDHDVPLLRVLPVAYVRFGHVDTALALASHGVTGCTLEDHHLGALPDASDVAPLSEWCPCNGWKTCSYCCWAFPTENGVWMKDCDATLDDASEAAWEAAETPLVRGILDISSHTKTLLFAMSDAAAARLLDIAILCGNVAAAANLAKTYQARPLRRWRTEDFWSFADLARWVSRFSAALCAGADFEGVLVKFVDYEVPLLRVLPLDFEPEDWQQLEQVLPSEKNQWPSCDVMAGGRFLTREIREDGLWRGSVSAQRVQNALRAGWDLKYIWTNVFGGERCCDASLLDLAVLCGQQECASALASAGVELRVDGLALHRLAFRRDGLEALQSELGFGSASECKSAASAAARAFLMNSFKREGVEKGIALYQTLAKKFHPRGVPRALVHHILGFSMKTPKILDQLDLWDEVKGWDPYLEVLAAQGDGTTSSADLDVKEEGSNVQEQTSRSAFSLWHAFCILLSFCTCSLPIY